MIKHICTLFALSTLLTPSAWATNTITGVLLERGTKKPLSSVNVFLLPSKLKGVTDTAGRFEFVDVPDGSTQFIANVPEYEKLVMDLILAPGESLLDQVFYVEKATYQVFETTIVGKQNKRDDTTKTLSAKLAQQLPGSGGDPVRAVQNLPGVARAPGLSSQIVIQGSAPEDTRYQIDGHEVPIIFHFGGLSSVVLPEALDRIDYLSAGFGPENGRAIGGLVGVHTKTPEKDRARGFAFVDLLNAGGAFETPIGENGSLFFGIRKSYIGTILKAVTKGDEDFSLTAAPSFDDATLIYSHKLSAKDEFKLVTVLSRDTLEFLLSTASDSDPALRGNFYNQTAFFRIIPQWTHRHSDSTTSKWSVGLGRDFVKVVLGQNFFNLRTYSATIRGEVEHRNSDTWKSYFGMDHRLATADIDLSLPNYYEAGGIANPVSTGGRRNISLRSNSSNRFGFYYQNDVQASEKWNFRPGVRLDYFQTTGEVLPAPRFAAKKTIDDYLFLKFATGLYYQPPAERETSTDAGNPDLDSPRAYHLSVSAEKDFKEGASRGFNLSGGPFFRYSDRLVTSSSALVTRNGIATRENYTNGGNGRAFGLESMLKFDFSPWSGWLSYTLSRSTTREPGQSWHVSENDQSHNINLIVARELQNNSRLSGRFRLVSGNPITPVTGGVYDADNDAYIPIRGAFYSERVSTFYQLDVRYDKKWIYDTWILTFYVDVQNITNRKNVESVGYAYDYSARSDVKGLPVIPILGLKGEF